MFILDIYKIYCDKLSCTMLKFNLESMDASTFKTKSMIQTAVIASSDDDVPPTPEVEVNKGRRRRRVKKLVSRQAVKRSHGFSWFLKKHLKWHKKMTYENEKNFCKLTYRMIFRELIIRVWEWQSDRQKNHLMQSATHCLTLLLFDDQQGCKF